MLIELIIFALVAVFVAIAALGHVLLAAAIVRCVRQDLPGGPRRMTAHGKAVAADNGLKPLVAQQLSRS